MSPDELVQGSDTTEGTPVAEREDTRKRRLIIEFELPDVYVDDLPEVLAEYGAPDQPMGEQILNEIGSVYFGALTIQIIGEKDGEVVTVPAIARDARIEDVEPDKDDHAEHVDRLMEDVTERLTEKAYGEGYDEGTKDAQRAAMEA